MEIYGIGGYNEVGKNMTAVDLGEDIIVFDCGLFLPPVIELEEGEIYTEKKLRSIKAVPSDEILSSKQKKKVRAIVPSHAHLDHIGAIPFVGHNYPNAEIIGTPFTVEVLNSLFKDEDLPIENNIKKIQPNSSYKIKGKNRNYKVDFINITHSTIQCSLLALHTPEGIILYANDFKLDNHPIVGKKPNYKKLKEIAKKGVKVLIVDSLYSGDERKTASEKVARAMLEDVLLTTNNKNSVLVVTTFSSHIARLKSIIDFSKKLKRKPILLGRSLRKYVDAAQKAKQCPFGKRVTIASYRNQLKRELKKVEKNRGKYMIVCTGHQGEKGAILDRMSRDELQFHLQPHDHVVFSSSVIPTKRTIENRNALDNRLKKKGVRLFTNIHVSGHAGREDLRDFIELINPEQIIPAHGEHEKTQPMIELAKELGYKRKDIHLINDRQKLKI